MAISEDQAEHPLLEAKPGQQNGDHRNGELIVSQEDGLASRFWAESQKLWRIVGPSILSRLANYSMNFIAQVFAGQLGEVELASMTIALTLIVGFNFGLLLGMASALETLCGQAFGAKKYDMLGIYLQRSWIVLFLTCFILLPLFFFTTPIMKALGQSDEVAEESGIVVLWLIPLHFSFAFVFPLSRFLQSQLKTAVIAWASLVALTVNILLCWVCVYVWDLGVVGAAVALDIAWWVNVLALYVYIVFCWCPNTWTGYSTQAFVGLWDYFKLSVSSGVMLCLETWYYRILILLTGHLQNATVALDALSICMNINGWELMIPLAFLAATGVRVANELGGGNGKAAKYAALVSVIHSTMIGLFFFILIIILHDKIAYIFTTSTDVVEAVDSLSHLLAFTILLNSVQPVLSGVAIGSGWQAWVAYINLGCYYFIGLPLGILMGWVFSFGTAGIWAGMIVGGTGIQTIILAVITIKRDWEKEAESSSLRVKKWSGHDDDQPQFLNE